MTPPSEKVRDWWPVVVTIFTIVISAVVSWVSLTSRVDNLDTRMGETETRLNARFDRVDERFDKVDDRFDRVDDRLWSLVSKQPPPKKPDGKGGPIEPPPGKK